MASDSPRDSGAKTFHCPTCKAEMTYDAGKQKLACQHCGHHMGIPDEDGQQSIVEHDLYKGLAAGAPKGLGTPVRTTRCGECGATVSFPENMTATACDFCGSSQILDQEENRKLIRPESVVPFKVDRKAASKSFSAWIKKLWFRPSDLKRLASVTEINGVYVPYWTFDASVESSWTAEAGYYYYETETYTEEDSDGQEVEKTREVQKTEWEPAWGGRSDEYDDLLICASGGLPADLAERLKSFSTEGLKPYAPAFLAGWKAEEYSKDLNTSWGEAVGQMESSQRDHCGGDVPGDTYRFLNVTNRFSDETFKHVLLPIWISAYRYHSKIFRFLVNGQTGEVVGKAPWSVVKIALFVLTLCALIALGVLLYMKLG